MTREDAEIALDHGADGLIVSNQGGRNEETLRASVDSLPEVLAAVRGRIPVFLDGGIRRGTDVFKALRAGRRRRWHRQAAGLGTGRVRAVRCRGCAGHPQYRVDRHHAPGGYGEHRGHHQRVSAALA